MSVEQALIAGIADTAANRALIADINSASARGRKADPGDRLDIVRFEALATRLEQLAINDPEAPRMPVALSGHSGATMLFGTTPADWSPGLPVEIRATAARIAAAGRIPVLVVDPLAAGRAVISDPVIADGPAQPWDSDGARGRAAVEKRFRAQVSQALAAADGARAAISPSGIQNSVITETLREFAAAQPGRRRVDVPVEYRDGSRSANPFALQALPLKLQLPACSLELKFALLSIRHTEMDAAVHGAWLRNADVSRPRPAGLTDDFVYDVTRSQLTELCLAETHVRLHVYQTGLETAVVGFYKALVDHLLCQPGSVSVQPLYYEAPLARRQGEQRSRKGAPHRQGSRAQVVAESALFRRGTPWTM